MSEVARVHVDIDCLGAPDVVERKVELYGDDMRTKVSEVMTAFGFNPSPDGPPIYVELRDIYTQGGTGE